MKPTSATLFSVAALPVLTMAAQAAEIDYSRLETIVVTASRHETRLLDAPASISVVTGEELRMRNADDLADALSSEVGLNINSVGQTRQGISIRGMPVEHTLYLIDGRRISSSNSVVAHSDYELSWLPDSAIERVEVVRGPMSSLYGADALGGVINVITRKPGTEFIAELNSTATRLEGSAGGDSNKTSIYLSGPLAGETLGFNLSAQTFNRDNLEDIDNPGSSEIEERDSKAAKGTLYWSPAEGHDLNASYGFNDDERDRDVATSRSSYRSSDEIDRRQASLSYRGQWEQSHAVVNAYYSELEVVNQRTNGVEATRPRTITDEVVDGHWATKIGSQHLLTLGGQIREETLEDTLVSANAEASATHKGLFVQDEWKPTEALQLVAGVGVDNHEEYGSEFNPRLYAVYDLTAAWALKGGYGEGFRAPSLTELSPGYEVLAAGGRFWVDGNPDLEPERSSSYELGLDYNNTHWFASLRVFENQLEDLVQSVCYTNCGQRGIERRAYQNLAESNILGAEISLQGDLVESLSFAVNYTYLDTEDEETGEDLQDRPEYMTRLNLNWRPLANTQVRWRSELNGKQYAGGGEYMPSYDLHHLDVAVDVGRYLTLYLGVENIFDERLADESDLYSLAEPGREFRLGFTAAL
ncbi:TonB-dependent receptor domain-containing protein [Parahaliea mediterranea]|uniref:TonB-dependent receptor n=1 Tax=Parahaliea mediterranea TaxID=651086 RepID=A0A939DEY4_9GAMM|nr:TonB-dependent receptor [Parahaliea mediterranea]MBN7796956.1 TonB-dependent receptor [Parahaliea mediterranea]